MLWTALSKCWENFSVLFPSGWGHTYLDFPHARRWNRWNGWMNGLGISSESPWAVYANSNWVRKSRQRTREVASTRSGQMSGKSSLSWVSLLRLLIKSAGKCVGWSEFFTKLAWYLLCITSPPATNKKGGEVWQRLMALQHPTSALCHSCIKLKDDRHENIERQKALTYSFKAKGI